MPSRYLQAILKLRKYKTSGTSALFPQREATQLLTLIHTPAHMMFAMGR